MLCKERLVTKIVKLKNQHFVQLTFDANKIFKCKSQTAKYETTKCLVNHRHQT